MSIDKKLTDSITIGDMDYIKDSLVKLNDTMWHYIYSIGFDSSHGMVTVRQLIIQNLNSKIHFSYVGDYNFYNIPEENDEEIFKYNYQYNIEIKDTSKSIVRMNFDEIRFIDNENSIDSTQEVVFLNYDKSRKIYYTSIDYLNGEFRLYPEEKKKREYDDSEPVYVLFENEKVYRIKIGRSNYIYFEDRWFKVKEYPYHTNIVSFLPIKDIAGEK